MGCTILRVGRLIPVVCWLWAASVGAREAITAINPSELPVLSPQKVALGRQLFEEPALAAGGVFSCASCHQLDKATADGRDFSLGRDDKPLGYNTPGVTYATLNHYFTWTGRFATLSDHLRGLIENPRILNTSWPEVIGRLKQLKDYPARFREAGYPALDADSVADALITFEQSLVAPSRFDYYLLGDTHRLSAREIRGYRLFNDYGCIACHQGQNIGGNMRQRFGILGDYYAGKAIRAGDLGYYQVSGDARDKYHFRVPSLRDVSRTAPYFHDGSAKTLSEAIEIMLEYQLGIVAPPEDVEDIEAFLKSLDGLR